MLAVFLVTVPLALGDDYGGDAIWLTVELAPPQAAHIDEEFQVVVSATFDPGSGADLAQYEYLAGPAMTFEGKTGGEDRGRVFICHLA
jgi:hypothetical protein